MAYLTDTPPASALRRPYLSDTPPAPSAPIPEVPSGDLSRGFSSGLHGTLASIQAFGASLADSMGFTDFARNQYDSAMARQELAASHAPSVPSYTQVNDFGSALRYGAGAVGQAAGSLLPTAAAGALGGARGAFYSLVPMSGGAIPLQHQQDLAEGKPEAMNATPQGVFNRALLQGGVQGALNMLPLGAVIGRGPLARGMTALTAGSSPGVRFATRMAGTALGEGLQEAGEEYTGQQLMRNLYGQEMGAPTDQEWQNIKEAGVAGAVGMVPFGVGSGISGATRDTGVGAWDLGKKGAGMAADAARAAAGSPQAAELRTLGGVAISNAQEATAAYREALQAMEQAQGTDTNPGVVNELRNHIEAIKTAWPVVVEGAKGTGEAAVATAKKFAGDLPDTLARGTENALNRVDRSRAFFKSLDALENMYQTGDPELDTAPGRQRMVSDAVARMGKASRYMTQEQKAAHDRWVNADPRTLLREGPAIAQQARAVAKEAIKGGGLDLFSEPLRKASLSPTFEKAVMKKEGRWDPLVKEIEQLFSYEPTDSAHPFANTTDENSPYYQKKHQPRVAPEGIPSGHVRDPAGNPILPSLSPFEKEMGQGTYTQAELIGPPGLPVPAQEKAAGKIQGAGPYTEAELRSMNDKQRAAAASAQPGQATALMEATARPTEQQKRAPVESGPVVQALEQHFDNVTDIRTRKYVRGLAGYMRQLVVDNEGAQPKFAAVFDNVGELFADDDKARAHVQRMLLEFNRLGADRNTLDPKDKTARKKIAERVKAARDSLVLGTPEPAIQKLAKLAGKSREEIGRYAYDYIATKMTLDRGHSDLMPPVRSVYAAIDEHNAGGEQIAEFEGEQIDAESSKGRAYVRRMISEALDADLRKKFGKNYQAAVNYLTELMPGSVDNRNLSVVVDGNRVPQLTVEESMDDDNERDESEAKEATPEQAGRQILTELGAFSRHSSIPKKYRVGNNVSEIGKQLANMRGGVFETGPDARLRHIDVREVALSELDQDIPDDVDPFSEEALSRVKSYRSKVIEMVEGAIERGRQQAEEALAELKAAGVDADQILSAAERESEAAFTEGEKFDSKKFFESKVPSKSVPNHEAELLNFVYWQRVREKHYDDKGVSEHIERFPYSVPAIYSKDELAAEYSDNRIKKNIIETETGDFEKVADHSKGQLAFNGPDGTVFVVDVRKVLEAALRNDEANFNPQMMQAALASFIEHMKDDSYLVDRNDPMPEETVQAIGLGGEMSPELAKALGVTEPSRLITPEQVMNFAKKGMANIEQGRVSGFVKDGVTMALDLRKAVAAAAQNRGMDPELYKKNDAENIAALLKDVLGAAKKAFDKVPKIGDLPKEAVLFVTDKGREIRINGLLRYLTGEENSEPSFAGTKADLGYRRTLAGIEKIEAALTGQGDVRAAVQEVNREIVDLRGMLNKVGKNDPKSEAYQKIMKRIRQAEHEKVGLITAAMQVPTSRTVDGKQVPYTAEQIAQARSAKFRETVNPASQRTALEASRADYIAEQEGESMAYAPDTETRKALAAGKMLGKGDFDIDEFDDAGIDKLIKSAKEGPEAKQKQSRTELLGILTSMQETADRLSGQNEDMRGYADTKDVSDLIHGEKRTTEGVREEDEYGKKIQYARPGELREKVAPLPQESSLISTFKDLLKDNPVSDIVDEISGYSKEDLTEIRSWLEGKTGPKMASLYKKVDRMVGDYGTTKKASYARTTEQGRQDDFGGDYRDKEIADGLLSHARKFGDNSADIEIRNVAGQAGEHITPTNPEEKARMWISRFALNPGQAFAHEDIHHLFTLLRKAGGRSQQVIETLIKATQNERILNQAREILTRDFDMDVPEQRAQAEALLNAFNNDPEERVAYLYQLRVAGLMESFNPAAETAIKKIFNWIMSKLGFLSAGEQAEKFLQALDTGKLAGEFDNPTALARAMGEEKRLALAYRSLEKALKPAIKQLSYAFMPSIDRVKSLNNPALSALADLYGRREPDESGRQGYYWEREKLRQGLENDFAAIVANATKEERDAALQQILRGNPQTELAQKLAAELKKYTKDLPNVPDLQRIEENRDEWMADVKEVVGITNMNAVRKALMEDGLDDMFGAESHLPKVEYKSDEKRLKWQRQTLEEYLGGWIKMYAANTARAEAFGPNAEKIKELISEARLKHGATDADIAVAKKFIGGVEGWLGRDMDPQLRKLQAVAMTGLNVFHLPFSIFSAMVDPIYIGVRSGSMTEAWNAYALGVKSIIDTFASKEGKLTGEAAKFAEDIRLISQAGLIEPMADMFSSMNLEGWSKKVNNVFFRYNLLSGWERAMFAASAMAAKRFILHHSTLPDQYSGEYLKELGLKKEDITTTPDGDLAVFEDDGLTAEQARRIQSAINMFSYQSAARPSAIANTIWMNDQRFALISHMKRFIMAQSTGVLDWMEKRQKLGDYAPMLYALPAVAVQLASGSVRNAITGGKSMPTDVLGAFFQGFTEAGLMGRWHLAADVMTGVAYNKGLGIGIDQIAGPAWSDFMSIIRNLRGGKS